MIYIYTYTDTQKKQLGNLLLGKSSVFHCQFGPWHCDAQNPRGHQCCHGCGRLAWSSCSAARCLSGFVKPCYIQKYQASLRKSNFASSLFFGNLMKNNDWGGNEVLTYSLFFFVHWFVDKFLNRDFDKLCGVLARQVWSFKVPRNYEQQWCYWCTPTGMTTMKQHMCNTYEYIYI